MAGCNFYWFALHVLLSTVQSSVALLVCPHAASHRSLVLWQGLETPLGSRSKSRLSRWSGFFLVRLLLVKDRHGERLDSRRILHGGLFCGLGLANRIISAAHPIAKQIPANGGSLPSQPSDPDTAFNLARPAEAMVAGANMASTLPRPVRHGRHESSAVRMHQRPESIPPARRDTGMCLLGETTQVIILPPTAQRMKRCRRHDRTCWRTATMDVYASGSAHHRSKRRSEDRRHAEAYLSGAHISAVLLVEDAPGAWAHRRIELDDMRTRGVYLARGRCLCLPLGREASPGLLRVRSIQDRQQDAGPAALATASSRSLA